MNDNAPVQETDKGALLLVRVQTGASAAGIEGAFNGRLKIKVCARPVKGAANKACIAMLSKKLRLAKSKVVLVDGERSKEKTFLLSGIAKERILSALGMDSI